VTLLAAHELATALLTTSALLAVLTGGQLHAATWLSLLCVPVAAWLKVQRRALPNSVAGAVALAAVLYGAAVTVAEGVAAVLLGAGYALVVLVCARLLSRQTLAHDLQLHALTLLLVLDAAALNVNWAYAPSFLVYTVSAVWALTTRELKRAAQEDHLARDGQGETPLWHARGLVSGRFLAATAATAVVVLLATLSLFVVFPRVGLGLLRLQVGRVSGFSESITLGQGGLLSPDSTVVMRVEPLDGRGPLPLGLYFRGAALDRYDGRTWSRTLTAPPWRKDWTLMPGAEDATRRYRVTLEPLGVPYVFTAGQVTRVVVMPGPRFWALPPMATRDALGDMVLTSVPDQVLNYEVEAELVPPSSGLLGGGSGYPAGANHHLATPGLSGKAKALAQAWTAGVSDPFLKTQALAQNLRRFAYTLEDAPPPPGTDALDHFLFTRQAGHCEYFASALALLSRSVGVPARVVGGYQGGALHPRRGYLVLRQSDAHAWTEVFVPGRGWVALDATPTAALERPELSFMASWAEVLQRAWEDYVVDYDLAMQVRAAQSAGDALSSLRGWRPRAPRLDRGDVAWLGGAVVLGGVAWAGVVVLRRRRGAPSAGHRLHQALRAATRRVTGTSEPTLTVREWVEATRPFLDHADGATMDGARQAYERSRFGGEPVDPDEEDHWVERLSTVRRVAHNPARSHAPQSPRAG
jgi:transglutaminase-like putative cysteine protease